MSRKREAMDLVKWAIARGWKHEGFDGRDHHLIRWTTGEAYRVPHTPSDHRSLLNVRARIAQIDGKPVEHIKRGKVKHSRASGFTTTRAVKDPQAERRTELLDALRDCAAKIRASNPRRDRQAVLALLAEAADLMGQLRTCGYVNDCEIPPLLVEAWRATRAAA